MADLAFGIARAHDVVCAKKNWTALKKIFDRHDVEATKIGTFTNSGKCVVRAKGHVVMDVGSHFSTMVAQSKNKD